MTGDSARCGRGRTGQKGPATGALTALKVAVGGTDRGLPGPDLVAVHGNTHRATRLAPFRTRRGEDMVKALGLGLALDLLGTRHDQHADPVGHRPASHDV